MIGRIKIIVFLTYSGSLKSWQSGGILYRELLIYQKLLDHKMKITFLSYGRNTEEAVIARTNGPFSILYNRYCLPTRLYTLLLPILHYKAFSQADLYKTNQSLGGIVAKRISMLFRKPLIARCGYMYSEFIGKQLGYDSAAWSKARRMENVLFTHANKVVVTTKTMLDDIVTRLTSCKEATTIVPNYVDTGLFSPPKTNDYQYDIVFVGRFEKQKNVSLLIEAISKLDLRVKFIGTGSCAAELKAYAVALNCKISWVDNIEHRLLPLVFNQSRCFVLPSLYEGHPKVLLEAMSCGMAVIGTNVKGIKEVIQDQVNGVLCELTPHDLSVSIQMLLLAPDLCKKLGSAAREYILENNSLDKIVEKEITVIQSLVM